MSDVTQRIAQGYTFDGPALELGAVVHDGTVDPQAPIRIPLAMVNRHGLIAGATGTGKTKTLQLMAEQLSAAGVAVFAPDIKSDLSGLVAPGETNDKIAQRVTDAENIRGHLPRTQRSSLRWAESGRERPFGRP